MVTMADVKHKITPFVATIIRDLKVKIKNAPPGTDGPDRECLAEIMRLLSK